MRLPKSRIWAIAGLCFLVLIITLGYRYISRLDKAKTWRVIDLPQLDGISVYLSTSWFDGKLYYKFTVLPGEKAEKAKENAAERDKFTILFYDKGGFKLLEIPVHLRSLTRIVDDDGKTISCHMNDAVECTSALYRKFKDWNVFWNFSISR